DFVQLAQEAEKVGGVVVVDEIFRPFIPGKEWTTVALKHPNLYATGSLTKVWGLGGLRIGWVIASPEVIARVYNVIDHIYVVMPFVSEYLSYQILKNNKVESSLLRRARDIALENLKIVTGFLDSLEGLSYHTPDGGIVLFCQWYDDFDGEHFCQELYCSHRILLQPGSFFGVKQGFRLGFGTGKEQLMKGLEKVRQVWENFHNQRF
ncbi:MAG: pyridoxal phosphate-dependent aminotransferase, partial [bacterium]